MGKLLTCQPPTLSLLPSSPWFLLDLPLSPSPSPPIISQLPPDQGVVFGHMSLKQTLALERDPLLHLAQWLERHREEKEGGRGGMIPMHVCTIREHLCRRNGRGGGGGGGNCQEGMVSGGKSLSSFTFEVSECVCV